MYNPFKSKGFKINIIYEEPNRIHPSAKGESTLTTDNLARFLEAKYHLLEIFTNMYAKQIVEMLTKEVMKPQKPNAERIFMKLENFIKNEWRDYIVNERHGIKTRAAQERGSESFVDTGAYFKNLSVKLELKYD